MANHQFNDKRKGLKLLRGLIPSLPRKLETKEKVVTVSRGSLFIVRHSPRHILLK